MVYILPLLGVCSMSVLLVNTPRVCAHVLLAGVFVCLSVSPCGHQRGADPIISVSLFLLSSRSPQTHPSTYLPVHPCIHPAISTSIIISIFKADSEWMCPSGGWEWGDACADFSSDLAPTRQIAIACSLPWPRSLCHPHFLCQTLTLAPSLSFSYSLCPP